MIAKKAFNLVDEPWIRVMDGSGEVRDVSLLGCFRQAHELKGLAGELPTQDVAVLRLLLAIVYAVFARVDAIGNRIDLDDIGKALDHWRGLWERRRFALEFMEKYLRHYGERFWLFHPETPFFQTAGLHTKDGKCNPVSQIVCDVPSQKERRFFCPRNGDGLESLSFAEAARWLIALHAWDYAGKKAAPVGGDPNGGGTGWLGKLGVVYAGRDNLFETLLLNMVLVNAAGKPLSLGRPCWEEDPKPAEKLERSPEGYVDLLTWQSRRVRLFAADDRVIGVLASYGDVFEKENTIIEQMSGWHSSSVKGQENNTIPNLHRADRSAWRDLGALLPQAQGDRCSGIPAGIVAWVAILTERKVFTEFNLLRLKTIGLEYESQWQTLVNELIADGIDVNVALLTKLGSQWRQMVFNNLKKTDEGVSLLGKFAGSLTEAAGGGDNRDSAGIVKNARELAYFALDIPFREWLAGIDPKKDDANEKGLEWLTTMRTILFQCARTLYEEAGEKAMTGIAKKNEKMNRMVYCNSFTAFSKFRRSFEKIVSGDRK